MTDLRNKEDMMLITSYSCDGLEGWLVKISYFQNKEDNFRKFHSKLFAFRDYKSKGDALDAARKYRDLWLEENKDKREPKNSGLGSRFSVYLSKSNTSGIIGVNRAEKSKKNGANWQTTYALPEGGVKNKKFKISIYGEVGALKMAIEARRSGILELMKSKINKDNNEDYEIIKFYDDVLENLDDYTDRSEEDSVVDIAKSKDILATTKLDQIQRRIGQQRFRREVLEFFNYKCAITSSSILIRASHIKPWRAATDEERINPANGLALSPTFDAAFDLGLISFRTDGHIMIAKSVESELIALGITGAEIIKNLTEEHLMFLDWHRKHIFLRKDNKQVSSNV